MKGCKASTRDDAIDPGLAGMCVGVTGGLLGAVGSSLPLHGRGFVCRRSVATYSSNGENMFKGSVVRYYYSVHGRWRSRFQGI
jgi:hypothetical protein